MRTLKIHHHTSFRHGKAATVSWQMVRLQPRAEANQTLLDFDLKVNPKQRDVSRRADYFGNIVHRFTTQASADALDMTMTSRVRRGQIELPSPEVTGPAGSVGAQADAAIAKGNFELQQYRQESPGVPLLKGATAIAAELNPEFPALMWVEQLGHAFSAQYTFDAKATLITTPLTQVIEERRGVCQDFSHLFISCLRQLGFPAAYVSGYLLTTPPPGKPRLRGVDAMHAWISVWLPVAGWVDYDPTNQCFVSDNHVVVARGRDYSDVSPIRGVFRGGSRHALKLEVTVEPEDAEADAEVAKSKPGLDLKTN